MSTEFVCDPSPSQALPVSRSPEHAATATNRPDSTSTSTSNNIHAFQQLDSYDWDGDQAFQRGLAASMGNAHSSEEVDDLILQAKIFFFGRFKGVSVDLHEYKQWKAHPLPLQSSGSRPLAYGQSQSQSQPQSVAPSAESNHNSSTEGEVVSNNNNNNTRSKPSSGGMSDVPYSSNFTDIVEMIITGIPIPGIKTIPDTVLGDKAASESKIKQRKKPWET